MLWLGYLHLCEMGDYGISVNWTIKPVVFWWNVCFQIKPILKKTTAYDAILIVYQKVTKNIADK